ncbi:MAG: FAD-dependent oxidoreductase [Candidatus Aminicenantes bacterium]|nr:FAD-dependent oxidoreductase [Candidatus Aminicenantes bacterium]
MAEYLIIGADAAGLSAANQIKRKIPKADIRIINKGRIISYGACGIPYVISGDIESPDKLIHFTPDSFERERGIPVEINKEAVGLLPEKHRVRIKNLITGEVEVEEYGKLLIGTGASPSKLPQLDYSQEGIFNLHDMEDLHRVLAYFDEKNPRRAAVIGAGNIGLELIEALHRREMEILLFDILEVPAANWPRAVQKAVEKKIIEKGIRFFARTSVDSIAASGSSISIEAGGREYTVDILFSVVGTKPSTDFCRNDLETLGNGAILVDKRGRTSEQDIFAAGDCATAYHKILNRIVYWPLGSAANKMGRIAGLNMCGQDISFPGVVGTQIFKFFELSLARTGLDPAGAEKEGMAAESFSAARVDKADYYPGAKTAYVEITVEKNTGRLIGATAVCENNAAQAIDTAAAAIFMGMKVADLGWFDSAYSPPFAPVWTALVAAALQAARI